jgi:hypothetical protein
MDISRSVIAVAGSVASWDVGSEVFGQIVQSIVGQPARDEVLKRRGNHFTLTVQPISCTLNLRVT